MHKYIAHSKRLPPQTGRAARLLIPSSTMSSIRPNSATEPQSAHRGARAAMPGYAPDRSLRRTGRRHVRPPAEDQPLDPAWCSAGGCPASGDGTTHDDPHRETHPAAQRLDRPVVRRPRRTDRHRLRRHLRHHRRTALPRRLRAADRHRGLRRGGGPTLLPRSDRSPGQRRLHRPGMGGDGPGDPEDRRRGRARAPCLSRLPGTSDATGPERAGRHPLGPDRTRRPHPCRPTAHRAPASRRCG